MKRMFQAVKQQKKKPVWERDSTMFYISFFNKDDFQRESFFMEV